MPRYALLFDHDWQVAEWCWLEFNLFPMPFNMAIGILDTWNDNELCGAAMFYWWNGCNIELNYYGPGTPTLGIFRILATLALKKFNVTRTTLRTSNANKHIISGMKKFGFIEEGTEKDFYGMGKDAQRLVIFRGGLMRLAGFGRDTAESHSIMTSMLPNGAGFNEAAASLPKITIAEKMCELNGAL